MKARIKFSKTGSMRFIGHLDVMRYFQKAFRRAGIRISYSQGYSPHQLMSFASPLGLGLTSEGEYLDIALEDAMTKEEMLVKVNAQMNDEIAVVDFTMLEDLAKPSMAVFAAADYVIYGKEGYELPSGFLDRFSAFLMQEEIIVTKKTKKSEKEMDIRPYIYEYAFTYDDWKKIVPSQTLPILEGEEDLQAVCYLRLTAGSIMNIKPELVLEAFCKKEGMEFNPYAYSIHRLEMYADDGAPKGKVRTKYDDEPCKLVPLSVYAAQ